MRYKTPILFALCLLLDVSAPAVAKQSPPITMAAAKATALRRVPGKVKSAKLETEKGRLVYSFDIITSDKKIMEVQIDAQTGEVVVVEEESEEHERQEEQHKRKRAKQGDAAQRP